MRHGIHFLLAALVGLLIAAHAHSSEPRTVWGELNAYVLAIRYAPDGKSLIAIEVEVGEKAASIKLLDRRTFKTVSSRRVSGEWRSAAIAPNGQWVALGGVNRVTRIEIVSGQQTDLALQADEILGMAISDDSQLLAISAFRDSDNEDNKEGVIRIWSVQTGKVIGTCKYKGASHEGVFMAFSPDGRLLRVSESEGHRSAIDRSGWDWTRRLREWDVRESRFVRSIALQKWEGVVATSVDGKLLAIGSVSENGPFHVRLIETEHYTTVKTLVPNGVTERLAFAPDGVHLVSLAMVEGPSLRTQIQVWDVKTGKEVAGTDVGAGADLGGITWWSIAFSSDGTEIAVGGADFPPQPAPDPRFPPNADQDSKMRGVLKVWRPYEPAPVGPASQPPAPAIWLLTRWLDLTFKFVPYHDGVPPDKIVLKLKLPPTLPGKQAIWEMDFEPKPERVDESHGDRIAHFVLNHPADGTVVRMHLKATLYESDFITISKLPSQKRQLALADRERWLLNKPATGRIDRLIREAPRATPGEGDMESLSRIRTYVDSRSAKPLERTSVFVALCRASQIPTGVWEGFMLPGSFTGQGYHRWAEVYLRDYGWVPVDPIFGEEPTHLYISHNPSDSDAFWTVDWQSASGRTKSVDVFPIVAITNDSNMIPCPMPKDR
jgi:hypothetical protein